MLNPDHLSQMSSPVVARHRAALKLNIQVFPAGQSGSPVNRRAQVRITPCYVNQPGGDDAVVTVSRAPPPIKTAVSRTIKTNAFSINRGPSLNLRALRQVARLAKQLKIGNDCRPAFRHRNDVVKMQAFPAPTLHTTAHCLCARLVRVLPRKSVLVWPLVDTASPLRVPRRYSDSHPSLS